MLRSSVYIKQKLKSSLLKPLVSLSRTPKRIRAFHATPPAEAISAFPEISFKSRNFEREAFGALQSKQGFIIKDLTASFSSSIETLFSSYDEFLSRPSEEKNKFKASGNLNSLIGYFPYGTHFAGCHQADRYWIDCNGKGVVTHPLPVSSKFSAGMKENAHAYVALTREIVWKVVHSVDHGFGLNAAFVNCFNNFGTTSILDAYVPLTQQKLLAWAAGKQLKRTNDAKIETFIAHQDLMAMTVLTYRNNQCIGLEVKKTDASGRSQFSPVFLGEPSSEIKAIVIAGKVLSHLTDGMLEACEHRVVGVPIKRGEYFRRHALNTFVNLDVAHNKELRPLLMSQPKGYRYSPVLLHSFFEMEAKKYIENARNEATTSLPPDELKLYPDEAEIEVFNAGGSVLYKRR